MQEILGGYTEVELSDGRKGNYEVARQYYRDFDRLRIETPEGFNRVCDAVLSKTPRAWNDAEKRDLTIAGLAFASAAEGKFVLKRPEDEISAFIRLAVRESLVSQIFGIVTSGEPQYDLRSPFKHHASGEPDEVPAERRQPVVLDWVGPDTREYPGYKLLPA